MSEEAKALKAAAETAGKAIDAGRSVGGLFKGLAAETVGLAEDSVAAFRGERKDRLNMERSLKQVELYQEAQERLHILGYSGKAVPIDDKVALPWLEHAPLEEDETLKDMWINLVISASVEGGGKTHPAFIGILSSISPQEALLLQYYESAPTKGTPHLCDSDGDPDWRNVTNSIIANASGTESSLDTIEAKALYENLERLNLIKVDIIEVVKPDRPGFRLNFTDYDHVSKEDPWISQGETDKFNKAMNFNKRNLNDKIVQHQHRIYLTAFGRQFMKSVTIEEVKQT